MKNFLWVKKLGLWILLAVSTAIIVAAAIFGMDLLIEYVFAPLLEFVLRLFTGAGR